MALKQLKVTNVEVGGMNFSITPLPAMTASKMTAELAGILAPLAAVIVPLVNENGLGDVDVSKAASAMMNTGALDGDKFEKLIKELLLNGTIAVEIENEDTGKMEGKRLTLDLYNEIFCCEILDAFVLMYHVLKINFGSFFKKLGSQSGIQDTETAKPRKIV